MEEITLYHNPRCSKSRQALATLTDRDLSLSVIHYLSTPLNHDELRALLQKLQLSAYQVIRTKEPIIRENNYKIDEMSEHELIDLITRHPILLERPIVANTTRAVIGRPPENIEEVL